MDLLGELGPYLGTRGQPGGLGRQLEGLGQQIEGLGTTCGTKVTAWGLEIPLGGQGHHLVGIRGTTWGLSAAISRERLQFTPSLDNNV